MAGLFRLATFANGALPKGLRLGQRRVASPLTAPVLRPGVQVRELASRGIFQNSSNIAELVKDAQYELVTSNVLKGFCEINMRKFKAFVEPVAQELDKKTESKTANDEKTKPKVNENLRELNEKRVAALSKFFKTINTDFCEDPALVLDAVTFDKIVDAVNSGLGNEFSHEESLLIIQFVAEQHQKQIERQSTLTLMKSLNNRVIPENINFQTVERLCCDNKGKKDVQQALVVILEESNSDLANKLAAQIMMKDMLYNFPDFYRGIGHERMREVVRFVDRSQGNPIDWAKLVQKFGAEITNSVDLGKELLEEKPIEDVRTLEEIVGKFAEQQQKENINTFLLLAEKLVDKDTLTKGLNKRAPSDPDSLVKAVQDLVKGR